MGMDATIRLPKKLLVLANDKYILCIYPYRDAEATKIIKKTRNVAIVGYGAPQIHQNQLINSVETALSFVQQRSGGKRETVSVFKSEGNQ